MPRPPQRPDPGPNEAGEIAIRRLAAIVESSDDAIISKDLNGIITSWNAGATRIFGYTADEMIGESILKLIPPELQSEEPEILRKLRAGQRIDHYETRRRAKDGHLIDVSLTVSPVRNAAGVIVGASKIARDISEHKRLDEIRSRLAGIVESCDDAIISKDLDGIITSWNAAATTLFGYEAHEIIGQSVLRLIPPDLHGEEPEILRRIRAGERIHHYETERIRKNGERFEASITISPIRDGSGRVVGASKIARDISQRKRAEVALIESEKMAAAGRLAAAIAHEVNNPLESITNLSFLLAKHPALPAEARTYAEMLLSEVARASEIAKSTLSFYRQTSVPVDIHMEELLDSLLRFHRHKLASKKLKVTTEFRASGVVSGFPAELRQVFANLLRNAIEASREGGEIRVRTSETSRPGGRGSLRVTIADHGSGVSPELRKKIFEPFFSTKGPAGHGLGLWVTQSIVRKHDAYLQLRSSTVPGRSGTVMSVVLPCRGAARQMSEAFSEPSAA